MLGALHDLSECFVAGQAADALHLADRVCMGVIQLGRTRSDVRLECVHARSAVVHCALRLGDASLALGDQALSSDHGLALGTDVIALITVAAVELGPALLGSVHEVLRGAGALVLGELNGP